MMLLRKYTIGDERTAMGKKLKIMVVDDNEYILELIKVMLKSEPFDIDFCSNVDEAVRRFESGEHFNLIITDIIMPEKDGTELAQYVKNKNTNIPVLAITGGLENALDDYVNYASLFADEAMPKPFRKEELLETISRLTAQSAY